MFNLSDTCKRLIFSDIICTIVLFAAGLAVIFAGYYNESVMSFTLGIVFAGLFTVLKLMLLEKAVNKAVDMNPEDSRNYMRMHYMSRYFLTGVVVVISIFVEAISLFGVILGLFALTPAAFIAGKMENAAKESKLK